MAHNEWEQGMTERFNRGWAGGFNNTYRYPFSDAVEAAYAKSPIVYAPGHERLSQQEIADIISEETGRDVRYQYINQEEWTRQLKAAAVHSGGLVNDAMIQHLPTHARTMADNTTIAARMDTDPSALAAASGRPPLTFRNFVRQHRSAFGALTANA